MSKVTSKDGTTIAFEKSGQGPALILVDGAMSYRAFGPSAPLADLLKDRFTVFTYDRRGRGESTDTAPYAVEREIEDLAALIQEAGGSAFVYGTSSGAALALEAANHGLPIPKLALHEPPFAVNSSSNIVPSGYLSQLNTMLKSNHRGAMVKSFLKLVGVPGFVVTMMQIMPPWSKMKSVAHTLPYDIAALGENAAGKPLPRTRWTSVTMPTVVMHGSKTTNSLRDAALELAEVLPNAQHRLLDGQMHIVKPESVAPVLIEFFAS